MNDLVNKEWWAETASRAIKTFAQTALGFLTLGVTGFADVDWLTLVSVSGLAALISLLMRISGGKADTQPQQLGTTVNIADQAKLDNIADRNKTNELIERISDYNKYNKDNNNIVYNETVDRIESSEENGK